ncbi:hypothetical protein HDA36_003879 [Nocardiopsis composta]|uniref:Amidohydrolase-related domain-containing protein n=1 Tax=Nocardiopsis composta TaxID=157465 RepID=A0A7W8VF74_9ACTN|nr:hypothetical protein [Nocardiopsis composta]
MSRNAAEQIPGDGERERVRAMWRGLGLPGLIDVHTHFMPDNVLRKVWAYFDALRNPDGSPYWPITYRADEGERVELLRGFGVRRFTSLLYPHRPAMAKWLNGWAAEFAARTPDCLHSATFYPEPEAAGYTAEAIGAGARIFKAHLQVGGYDPRDPLLAGVWGALADSGTPVVVHCGSGPEPGPFTGPGPFAEVLREHPRLTAVIAHAGTPEYTAFLDLAERYEGVHLDTTMVFTDFTERTAPFPAGELPRLAELGGRVLLGTDFPNIPYPYLEQLEALAGLGLGEDWLRAVLYGNAARLFGAPAP